ncbi:MAG: leucine-rich repeat domain-containing protein [Bacteroidaceae bacterium]|nr:leucine-rich repeat domain-containing protein [Bacteroidaceae bacterium]
MSKPTDFMENNSAQDQALTLLCERIEQVVGRKMRTPKDFDFLSERIFETLHQNISATTLKRIWGYLAEPVVPRLSTLNLLAQYVGADNWEAFSQQSQNLSSASEPVQIASDKVHHKKFSHTNIWRIVFIVLPILMMIALAAFFLHTSSSSDDAPIDFADPAVKALCVAHWDTNGDGELSLKEAAHVTHLDSVFRGDTTIISFNEFECFTRMEAIEEKEFQGCKNLQSTHIPPSIKIIRHNAFQECQSLIHMDIPANVEVCQSYVFYGCKNLQSIHVGKGIRAIGGNFLATCPNLVSIEVSEENSVFDSRNHCNAIMETATNRLIAGCQTTVVPQETTALAYGAFEGCWLMKHIHLPEGITSIGIFAFNYNVSLTSIELPSTLTMIENNAFNCCNFKSVISHATTPPTLGTNIFCGIPNDCVLTVPQGTRTAYIAAGWTEEVFGGGVVETAQ